MSNNTEQGEIDLTPQFIHDMSQMCEKPENGNVTFIVEGIKLPAHKNILAARSSYFRAMLYGGLAVSSQKEIELKVSLDVFKALLKYMYTGRMSLDKLSSKEILECLSLTDLYGFEDLKLAISNYLTKHLSLENCYAILDAAQLFRLDTLTDASITFMATNFNELVISHSFQTLSEDLLCTLLDRDSLFAPELQIFNAVCDWYSKNPNADIKTIVSLIRFPLMSWKELFGNVLSSNIVDQDSLFDAIKEKTTSDNLRYRGAFRPDENIASAKYNAKTIQGLNPSVLLDGNITNYDGSNGFTFHKIGCNQRIMVELGENSVINHIKLLLWDRDARKYSYYIETSVNQKKWERVVDRTKGGYQSWQHLYFPSRVVRYIKLVGTHNTAHNQFHVVALEAYFASKVPTQDNDPSQVSS